MNFNLKIFLKTRELIIFPPTSNRVGSVGEFLDNQQRFGARGEKVININRGISRAISPPCERRYRNVGRNLAVGILTSL